MLIVFRRLDGSPWTMNRTPIGALLHQAQIRPKSTAFIFDDDKWTYARLAAESKRLAQGLAERGIVAGDRIALHMKNRPKMLVAYFACFQLGAVAAPLRTTFRPAAIGSLLRRLKPALYIGERGLSDGLALLDVPTLAPENCFIVAAADTSSAQRWERLFEGSAENCREMTPAPHEAAVFFNTSGTTGEPKFVIHTPSTLFEGACFLGKCFGIAGDDNFPLHFGLAQVSGLVTALSLIQVGAAFILFDRFDPDAVLDVIERDRCGLCGGFPAHYAAMLDRQIASPRDLSSLRMCLTFGDSDLQAPFSQAIGAPLYNLWGSTEVVGSLTHGLQFGPVSRIVKGNRIRLINDDGEEVSHGEVGELLVRGPNVFTGYWGDPTATADSLKGGWYHTGDLMRRGDGDDVWFVSRKADRIIRDGINISPVEIEEALVASHRGIEAAAAVGIPDKVHGQRIVGFVTLAAGAEISNMADVLGEAAKRLADYKLPEDLAVLSEMPRNALSRLDRKVLKVMASDRWQRT
jgi:long-chain acyl-CoA synthetase